MTDTPRKTTEVLACGGCPVLSYPNCRLGYTTHTRDGYLVSSDCKLVKIQLTTGKAYSPSMMTFKNIPVYKGSKTVEEQYREMMSHTKLKETSPHSPVPELDDTVVRARLEAHGLPRDSVESKEDTSD